MTDLLDVQRKQITDRMTELKPVIEEYGRLEAAVSALAKVSAATPAAATIADSAPRRRGPGRPRRSVNSASKATPAGAPAASAPAKAARKKPGRPPGKVGRPPGRPRARAGGRRKGSGTRAAQALSLVQGAPGITIPELATKMNIKQNYLYRVLPGLEQDGKLEKKGRGWHPKGATPAAA